MRLRCKDDEKLFKGVCPYTDKPCKIWICRFCRVEMRERRFMRRKDL